MRHPFLESSLIAHAALLLLLYFYGGYQSDRRLKTEVASSLRATSLVSTAKRLEDLQTIKRLLQKSADGVDIQPEPGADNSAAPQTLEEVLERAREISQAIDAIDREIQAEELAELLGLPQPPPFDELPQTAVPNAPDTESNVVEDIMAPMHEESGSQASVSDEMVAQQVDMLVAKARATLERRQHRLEAKIEGVQVKGEKLGKGQQDAEGNASVLAEIVAHIGAESSAQAVHSTIYAAEYFFDGAKSEIPPVDATGLVRGRGRLFGAGGEYANRVYLNSWYIIGPFPGRHGNGLFDNPSYPPEKAVLLDAVYFGKGNRLLRWRYVTAHTYPLIPPDLAEDSVYYGYTEVLVDEACDLTAWIGADDDVHIYLNGQKVWERGNVNKMPFFFTIFHTDNTYLHDYNRTEGMQVLHFNKGRNKIFFKFSNGASGGFLSIVLTR